MRIGLNLLFIRSSTTGGSATYAVNLINALSKIDKKNEYIVYINKNCTKLPLNIGSNFYIKIIPFSSTNPIKRLFLEQVIFPIYFMNDNLNLLHSLGYHGPIFSTVPHIVSILDLNFIRHKHMSKIHSFFLGLMVKIMTKTCKHIITISEFSKNEIVKNLNVNKKNITTTLLSGSNDSLKINESIDIKKIYGIKKNYIIAFGSNSSHKNIDKLIFAYSELSEYNYEVQLVLVGYQHKASSLRKIVNSLNLDHNVIFTGFVPSDHVFQLISKSMLFVFPSFYEGFGIPLLDAQAFGIPIASSNAGSLPEVGANGCLYFDPSDIQQMISVIKKIINNKTLSNELIENGLVNRSKFSWELTSKQTLNCYLNNSI